MRVAGGVWGDVCGGLVFLFFWFVLQTHCGCVQVDCWRSPRAFRHKGHFQRPGAFIFHHCLLPTGSTPPRCVFKHDHLTLKRLPNASESCSETWYTCVTLSCALPSHAPPQLISLNLAAKASLADNAFTAACVLGYAEVVTVFCFGLGKTGRILDDIDSLCRHQEMSHVTWHMIRTFAHCTVLTLSQSTTLRALLRVLCILWRDQPIDWECYDTMYGFYAF